MVLDRLLIWRRSIGSISGGAAITHRGFDYCHRHPPTTEYTRILREFPASQRILEYGVPHHILWM